MATVISGSRVEGNNCNTSNPLAVTFGDTPFIDAFGRLRISNPETLFDSKNIFNNGDISTDAENQPLFYDNQETSGSGTSTEYKPNNAAQVLKVSADTAGTRVRQTRQRFNYQPGKSLLVLMSHVMGGADSGIIRREGIFDEDNGLFLEDNEGTYNFVRRTYVTGTAVDNKVAQANWNIDSMDGTGVSGINLDFTKTQILAFDYEWLGVGRVRVGFVIDGLIYYAHEFLNANFLSEVYMSTPNLPLRSEIVNDGTGGDAELHQICSTVISEGGQNPLGTVRSASTNGTHVDMATENTVYAILGIRLKSSHIGEVIQILNISLQLHTASDKCEWFLLFNPAVAGTFTYADEPVSAVQIARGAAANTVTGGYRIQGGHIASSGFFAGASGSTATGSLNSLNLGSLIDGTPDEIVLCARPIAGSSGVDIEGSLTWRELN